MAANAAAISPQKRRRTAAATPPKPAKALDSVAKVHDLLRGEAGRQCDWGDVWGWRAAMQGEAVS